MFQRENRVARLRQNLKPYVHLSPDELFRRRDEVIAAAVEPGPVGKYLRTYRNRLGEAKRPNKLRKALEVLAAKAEPPLSHRRR